MYTKYLFDLDGVLVDTIDIQMSATKDAIFEISGQHVDGELIESTIPTTKKLKQLADDGIIEKSQIDTIYELKKDKTEAYMAKLPIDKVKIELFKHIKENGHQIAVITNSNKRSASFLLKQIGIFEYIDYFIANVDVKNNKPHSEPYIRAICRFGGELEDYIIFEDSEVGLQSARGTGASVYHVHHVNDVNVDLVKQLNHMKYTHGTFVS
jgi:beta-phosphoglucomutase